MKIGSFGGPNFLEVVVSLQIWGLGQGETVGKILWPSGVQFWTFCDHDVVDLSAAVMIKYEGTESCTFLFAFCR